MKCGKHKSSKGFKENIMKYQEHRLAYVIPQMNYEMICQFRNGECKIFDFKPIIEKYPQFKELMEGDTFYRAYVDLGGLCVTFNERLDISEETLYQKGRKFDRKKESKQFMKELYSSIKQIRIKSNVTQKQLSAITSIPQSGIARIESGNSNVQLDTLFNYLDPLGYKISIVKK